MNKLLHMVKAKTLSDGQWIIGFINYMTNKSIQIIDEDFNDAAFVQEDTICRCIGCQDKANTPIFEHDIVAFPSELPMLVCYNETECRFMLINKNQQLPITAQTELNHCRVIGNGFEDLDLLNIIYRGE